MREKIEELELWVRTPEGYIVPIHLDDEDCDQIFKEQREEIAKVENPYVPIRSGTSDADRANTFESCRQKILALLK